MRRTLRSQRLKRDVERNAQALQPIVALAGLQKSGASGFPVVGEAFQIRLAARIGRKELD
jgi:hypothetical protein